LLADLTVDEDGLSFSASAEDDDRLVDLLLHGRRIWTFRVVEGDRLADDRRWLAWPRPLRPYLSGVAHLALRPLDGGPDEPAASTRFGTSSERMQFVDPDGLGLVVNSKFDRLGHALADYDDGLVQRLLDRMDEVRDVVAGCGLDVYVMSGTLLGPYRDGQLMRHDDDTDLGYLSRHRHPVDVVREAFSVGRRLRAVGYDVIRASGGHLQLHFSHEGRPDAYVDVFTGWIDDWGWWNQAFLIRARVARSQILPTTTIDIEGRPEPAPRDPEAILEANYGPGWRVPDPSFRFDVPRSTGDRFWGWLGDHGMDRAAWEDYYRYDAKGSRLGLGSRPADSVRDLAARLPPSARILVLGSGRGHDALWLAGQGHQVEAIDYVRWPTRSAARVAEEQGLPAHFRIVNLYDLRRVIALGAELAAADRPIVVVAHGLLGSLWDEGRPHLFRLLSMILRRGGEAHLDVPQQSLAPVHRQGPPLHRSLPLDTLMGEMSRFGLRVTDACEAVDELEHSPWSDGRISVPATRMVVTWHCSTR
jgi:hypothetical protein